MDNEFKSINVRLVRGRLTQLGYTLEYDYNPRRCVAEAYKIQKGAGGKEELVGLRIDAERFEYTEINARGDTTKPWESCTKLFANLPAPAYRNVRAKKDDLDEDDDDDK